jgi:hypothetical protein
VDWSSYEVQLLAGNVLDGSIEKGNGAFYGVGTDVQEVREFRFDAGQTYDILLRVVDQRFEVLMKWSEQSDYFLVSKMESRGVKSSRPGHIGLQSYYSNGHSVQALLFERISIIPL